MVSGGVLVCILNERLVVLVVCFLAINSAVGLLLSHAPVELGLDTVPP